MKSNHHVHTWMRIDLGSQGRIYDRTFHIRSVCAYILQERNSLPTVCRHRFQNMYFYSKSDISVLI